MKRKIALVIIMCTSMLLTACGRKEVQTKDTIMVLAASSLTDVLEEIQRDYEQSQDQYQLQFSYDSSGTCKMQIEQGAKADVFLSASSLPVTELSKQDLIDKDSVTDLLTNEIVLISKAGSEHTIDSFEEIVLNEDVTMIATCMEEVPIGQYTLELYQSLGLQEQLASKANYASNVRQVLDWVASGNAPYGIVYATDAAIEDDVTVRAVADPSLYEKVVYQGAVIASSTHKSGARDFLEYLKSDAASEIFHKYGFETVR